MPCPAVLPMSFFTVNAAQQGVSLSGSELADLSLRLMKSLEKIEAADPILAERLNVLRKSPRRHAIHLPNRSNGNRQAANFKAPLIDGFNFSSPSGVDGECAPTVTFYDPDFKEGTSPETVREHDLSSDGFYIDGDEWIFVLRPSHCERHVDAAIREYLKNPIYNINRPLEASRFLINESGECWVEVEAVGASDIYFLFRFSERGNVVDKKMFSERPPHINDYPSAPFER